MSRCYHCQCVGEHYEWCTAYVKVPINIPQVPEDAVVPTVIFGGLYGWTPTDQLELVAGTGFVTKDSGERQEFSTGMVRDTQTNKPRYDLLDSPMLKRWAELMARGALKYGEDNWRKASTEEELKRFTASLLRHTFQLIEGDRTEDHAAAIMFNVAGIEMVRSKLNDKGN